jgi:hypothetical protein
MLCVDGSDHQCSGDTVLRTDHGIAMTRSGVQVYGRSSSDRLDPARADGLAPASGGVAEVRVAKDATGVVTRTALLLRGMGISWDGVTERPQTIETFRPHQARVTLTDAGALAFAPLPPRSDLDFYDYGWRGLRATQAHYANNVYFPRSDPSRCPDYLSECPVTETPGLWYYPHNHWRTTGHHPDHAFFVRVHNDGDVHAGDADASGAPLPGGTGPGVPFPGSKGYRSAHVFGFWYANLAVWLSQDTVNLYEWGGADEHNTNRRGLVAFGPTTDADSVPVSGQARYADGFVAGLYVGAAGADPIRFRGRVDVTVDFATGAATVSIRDTFPEGREEARAGLDFDVQVAIAAATGGTANYLNGPVTAGPVSMQGGLGARFFGPLVAGGTGGIGPAEIGGTFHAVGETDGSMLLGGFIARKP